MTLNGYAEIKGSLMYRDRKSILKIFIWEPKQYMEHHIYIRYRAETIIY